jgi:hypothetical protein
MAAPALSIASTFERLEERFRALDRASRGASGLELLAGYVAQVTIEPDEIDGGRYIALSRPRELADRLATYALEVA